MDKTLDPTKPLRYKISHEPINLEFLFEGIIGSQLGAEAPRKRLFFRDKKCLEIYYLDGRNANQSSRPYFDIENVPEELWVFLFKYSINSIMIGCSNTYSSETLAREAGLHYQSTHDRVFIKTVQVA